MKALLLLLILLNMLRYTYLITLLVGAFRYTSITKKNESPGHGEPLLPDYFMLEKQ
ncbi:hypothetical protein Hanom_Chr14g01257411 [Helianthus anomalus]